MVEKIKNNFDDIIKEGEKIIDFNATWCGPCRMLTPILKEVAEEKNITIYSLDVDENPEVSGRYNVFSIPTIIKFKDGKEIERKIGFMPKEEVEKFIGE